MKKTSRDREVMFSVAGTLLLDEFKARGWKGHGHDGYTNVYHEDKSVDIRPSVDPPNGVLIKFNCALIAGGRVIDTTHTLDLANRESAGELVACLTFGADLLSRKMI